MSDERNDVQGGIIGWFAANSVTANLIMVFLIVGGLFMASRMNLEAFPEVDPRMINVAVAYPGATPEEVQYAVTRRVEEAILGLDGIKRVRSTASEGMGTVSVEVENFVDIQLVKDEIDQEVGGISDFPPGEAEAPLITIAKPSVRVMRIALSGDVSEAELRMEAERLREALLSDDELTRVNISGGREYEISIEVSEAKLREFGLSLPQVASAVQSESVELSAGRLRTQGGEFLLRTNQERRTAAAFAEIPVRTNADGGQVRLGEIAGIHDAFEEGQLVNRVDGDDTLFIDIGKADDQDAFQVATAVRSAVAQYSLDDRFALKVISNETLEVSERLNLVMRNAVFGLALVFLFLALVLDLRIAFWTSLGIPIAFFGSFLLFGQLTTLNMISMFGLIVVLGIVVDDAIVVAENIHEETRNGRKGLAASIRGTLGVMSPVTVGVLTTIFAFAPLAFSAGTLGQVLRPVPIVVVSVLIISVIEAFFVLPAHLAHGGNWSRGAMSSVRKSVQSGLFWLRDHIVLPVVRTSVSFRYITLACVIASIVMIGGLFGSGMLRFIFMPPVEADEISVSLEMPEGTPFAETDRVMSRIREAAYEAVGGENAELLDSYQETVGGRVSADAGPGSSSQTTMNSSSGSATLKLIPAAQRDTTAAEVLQQWREALGPVAGVQSLSFNSSLFSAGDDISIDLTHPDDALLAKAVRDLETRLSQMSGVFDVETSLDGGVQQYEFELTNEGAAAGLTTQEIARQVRASFFGMEVQRIQRGSNEVRVYVRLPASERETLGSFDQVRIRLNDGSEAPLGLVAKISETSSPSNITRVDGNRVISVIADVDEAIVTPTAANAQIEQGILADLIAADSRLEFSFAGAQLQLEEEMVGLGRNLMIGLGLIYLLLASTLRSYTQPLIVMSAIPLAAVSALYGHLILGHPVTFPSMFGIVALSGVVINANVVLLDYSNSLIRNEKMLPYDAILAAVERRFRPILLTTLTTFLGLVPMLAETSLQAQILIPMTVSLGFGILFAGLLLLVLTPVLVLIGEDIKSATASMFGVRRRASGDGPAA